MQAKAVEVASIMRREPGVHGAVSHVRRILCDDVYSGAWRRRWEDGEPERRKQQERREKRKANTARAQENRPQVNEPLPGGEAPTGAPADRQVTGLGLDV